MSRRVHLHLGAPKSGTTYLQSRLYANQRSLRRHGLEYPLGGLRDARLHYYAALDVTGRDHGLPRADVQGSWPRLLRAVRRARGDVVVSHELLSWADPEQARRVLDDLAEIGADVHLVVSARDLARELCAGWQELVKFGGTRSFADYLERARAGRRGFQDGFDLPRVLTVWGADLPADRLHLVTAPQSGPPDLLWHRFLEALDARAAWAPREAERANESVGVAQARMLRVLNRKVGAATRRGGDFASIVERVVVPALATGTSTRITIGPDHLPWITERSEDWTAWLRQRGVRVHGDLEDLRPAPPSDDRVDPDRRMPTQVAAAALDVVEALLDELSRRPDPPTARVRRLLDRYRP